MIDRNQFLESDGMFFESDTHEWFQDNSSTGYAQIEDSRGISLPNIVCFVVRDKSTGNYDRVIMDKTDNSVIYSSQSLEDIGVKIDMMKTLNQYKEEDEIQH